LKSFVRFSLVVLIATVCSIPMFSQQNNLSITISNIRSDRGLVRLALYDRQEQFPDEPWKSYTFEKSRLEDGSLQVTLNDISPGIYAISILDDEDANDRMKYGILRIPKEGYGFSNNAKPGMKCPPFENCSFRVNQGNNHLHIEMLYFREKA